MAKAPKVPDEMAAALAQIQSAAMAKLDGRKNRPPTDEAFFRDFPFIAAWMTFDKLPDGTWKVPAQVIIRVDDGDFRVTLQDSATGQAASALSATLEGCYAALEKTLADPALKWQVWQERGLKLKKATSEKSS